MRVFTSGLLAPVAKGFFKVVTTGVDKGFVIVGLTTGADKGFG